MKSLDHYDKEIAKLETKIKELAKEKEILESMTADKQLAIELHDLLCTHNHTDGCSWFYEISRGEHDWTRWAHHEYWKRACVIEAFCEKHNITTTQAVQLIKVALQRN